MTTIKFCDEEILSRLERIDLIRDETLERRLAIEDYRRECATRDDSPLDGPQITNLEIFRRYIAAYLRSRPDIYNSERTLLVRTLDPAPTGIPVEIYLFTRTTKWEEFEAIQSEISEHLLAAAPHFDLRIFQQPTGVDFAQLTHSMV